MPVSVDKWNEGLNFEVAFWQKFLNSKGSHWPQAYLDRTNPDQPFDKMVEAAILDTSEREIDVLDVGAGPITALGYVSKKFDIRITAIDALADVYDVLLKEAGVTPPVATQMCFGENLLAHFGNRRFHVCHSSNALDHSMDPMTILIAMAQLLRPNGLLYVKVYRNEGHRNRYSGLHNWNFDKNDKNNFVLWRENEKHNINKELSKLVERCNLTDEMEAEDHALTFTAYRKAL